MDIRIIPRKLSGDIDIIASKSHAHRILICAALAKEKVNMICSESSEDIDATARCLNGLGADIERTSEGFTITPITEVDTEVLLDCGESGSTLRFLLPVIGALGVQAKVKMSGRLPQRPLSPLWEELCAHGMTLERVESDVIQCGGKLRSGEYTIPGNISSQFISGLLFALPILEGDSKIIISGKTESEAYITMTLNALSEFGVKIGRQSYGFSIEGGQRPVWSKSTAIKAEGDWSNAAFWLCAGALSEVGITCGGLDLASVQGDRAMVNILREFGAQVDECDDGVAVVKSPMNGCMIDAAHIPDLVPILSVCACAAQGVTRVINAQRLRIKESDRIKTTKEMLSRLGAQIEETEDGLLITGDRKLRGDAEVDACGDHRIAMSAAIASCICAAPIVIKGAEAVNKSYPKFWEHFRMLGGEVCEVQQ